MSSLSSRVRTAVVVALGIGVLAAACAGGDEGPARDQAAAATVVTRPSLPAVIDSVTAESLAVDSALRGVADRSHALFSCFVGDSATYADLRLDSFGDTVGVRITLWVAGDGVDGSRAEVGEPTPPTPLSGVRLFAADSIMLDFPASMALAAGETSRFVGRIGCDRMWGKQRNYRDAPTRPVSYARVRDAF